MKKEVESMLVKEYEGRMSAAFIKGLMSEDRSYMARLAHHHL